MKEKYIIFISIFISLIFSNITIGQNPEWINYIAGGKKINAIAEEGSYLWIGTDIGLVKLNKIDGNKEFGNCKRSCTKLNWCYGSKEF